MRRVEPLGNRTKASVPMPSAMLIALDEMAAVRGLKRTELIRRVLAAAIVDDSPHALDTISKARREEIETYGGLWI